MNKDKYLKIKVPFGENRDLEFIAVPNPDATEENGQPHYRIRTGGAVWVKNKEK